MGSCRQRLILSRPQRPSVQTGQNPKPCGVSGRDCRPPASGLLRRGSTGLRPTHRACQRDLGCPDKSGPAWSWFASDQPASAQVCRADEKGNRGSTALLRPVRRRPYSPCDHPWICRRSVSGREDPRDDSSGRRLRANSPAIRAGGPAAAFSR